jgi:L-threonylcarbamoyladenylate synthase
VATAAEISMAAAVLAQGGLVAVPTETVYGLAADALNPRAVRRIFELKGRPATHPLIVHLPAPVEPTPAAWKHLLESWAIHVPQLAIDLATAFWPGPLTVILRRAAHVPDEVTGGLATVGLRVPAHPVAQGLLTEFAAQRPPGRTGLAAPSANRFGHISPTNAGHVQDDFGKSLLLASEVISTHGELPSGVAGVILDGGAAEIGIESTIVDLSHGALRILRPGAIGLEQLHAGLGKSSTEKPRTEHSTQDRSLEVRAPGTLEQHYAPRAVLHQLEAWDLPGFLRASHSADAGPQGSEFALPPVALIAPRGLLREHALPGHFVPIHLGDTLVEQAQGLYAALREADAAADLIYAVLPEAAGIGIAIRDRLQRAAARHDRPV